MPLNPFPDKQIPPDEKDYSNNEDYVVILGHPIWNPNDANSTYDKDERFVLENVSGASLFHAISPVRRNVRANFS